MSTYFDPTPLEVIALDLAKAEDLNAYGTAIDAALDLVEADIINVNDDAEAWAAISEEWAATAEDTEVEVGLYSSLHYAAKSGDSAVASASSASAASTSESNAGTSESNASDSETAAATSESNASDSEDASVIAQGLSEDAQADSETAQGLSEDARDASIVAQGLSEDAQTASETAQGLAETARTGAETAETNAETAQGLSEDARDASIVAQGLSEDAQTASELAEANVSSYAKIEIDRIVASVDAVDVFRYDTSNDSDGGAWRERCEGLSWYNEPLNTATRGKTRKFPAVALIVAEALKVTIYDATDDTVPMWMVFDINFNASSSRMAGYATPTQLEAAQGKLCVGHESTGVHVDALTVIDFIADSSFQYTHDASYYTASPGACGEWSHGVISRNDTSVGYSGSSSTLVMVHYNVNDVAMTVEADVPIDPATGLQRPTIAVGTGGGKNVINSDESVTTGSDLNPVSQLAFDGDGNLAAALANASYNTLVVTRYPDYKADSFGGTIYRSSASQSGVAPHVLGFSYEVCDGFIVGSPDGLTHLKENPTTPAEGMVAYTTYAWASGWMHGDIKGAWLANSKTEDRSVNANPLVEHGTVTETAVATNAELMAYSGFSASNYLEQPYNADLDFGTGDFYIMGWVYAQVSTTQGVIADRGNGAGSAIQLAFNATGNIIAYITDDNYATNDSIESSATQAAGSFVNFVLVRRGTALELWVNGAKAASDTTITNAAGSLSNASASLFLGRRNDGVAPLATGSLSLTRIGKGAPSAEQMAETYNDEKRFFTEGSKCTLAGTSDAVLALDYDEDTEITTVATSYGHTRFDGLLNIADGATAVGTPSCISTGGGDIALGGSTAVTFYSPAESLRAELKNQETTGNPLALEPFWFVGDASETDFDLPAGWKPKFVYDAGLLVKDGASDEYVVEYDGFIYTVAFAVAPANGNDVCIMGVN